MIKINHIMHNKQLKQSAISLSTTATEQYKHITYTPLKISVMKHNSESALTYKNIIKSKQHHSKTK